VQDLLTLFRALHHRADRVHWLALLRAPWCGLTLADLHALAAGDTQRTVWQLLNDEVRLAALSADGRNRLDPLRTVLATAFAERGRQHPRRWLEGVWLMLGGPRCLEAPESLADVEAFFALVDRLAAAGNLDPDTLAAQAGELFAPADPRGDQVQMMTVHKAKGLEFDTVILPGLHRETGGNESQLLLWDEVAGADGHAHLLVAPLKQKGAGTDGPTAYDFLKRFEAERTAHEAERLLYVAATRAIRHLHLVGCATPDDGKEDGLKPPAAGSLLKLLWPGVARPAFIAALAQDTEAAPLPASIDPASFVPPLVRLAAVGLPDALGPLPVDVLPAPNPLELEDAASAPALEASVGTLVHRILELIAKDGLDGWSTARVSRLQPAWRRWLAARGHDPDEAAAGAAEAVQAVIATLAAESGRWLLSAHDAAGAEQAWTSRDGTTTVNHVIDRTFIADGQRWIIDYKTVRAPPEELGVRAESFRPQLERYARLFADDPLPLRLAIFFPIQAILVELH
jgi:ATP-dependent exoDNAse (exonuclease V) beta subunit